ncbi:MAG: acylphosphatase [Ginsengibacter sp.]
MHLEISGKVQGVFFRAKAKEVATIHNISGWIRNTHNDTVEALVTAAEKDLDAFISWCKRGPEKAKVQRVESTEKEFQTFERFEVIR